MAYSYELPFGPGKRYLSSGILSHVAGGWEISGYQRIASGAPLTITVGNNLSALGYPGKRASYVAGQPIHLNSNPRDFDPAVDRVLNADAFSIPDAFEFGNTARVLDWARGWTERSESLSVRKRIPIYERMRLVIRADIDNPGNFVRWSDPNTNRSDANFGKVTGSAAAAMKRRSGTRASKAIGSKTPKTKTSSATYSVASSFARFSKMPMPVLPTVYAIAAPTPIGAKYITMFVNLNIASASVHEETAVELQRILGLVFTPILFRTISKRQEHRPRHGHSARVVSRPSG